MGFINPYQHLIKINHNDNKTVIAAVVETFLGKNCKPYPLIIWSEHCRGDLKAPVDYHQKLTCGSISRQCKSETEGVWDPGPWVETPL